MKPNSTAPNRKNSILLRVNLLALLAATTGLNFTAGADDTGKPRDLQDALVSYTWVWTQATPQAEEPVTRKVHFTAAGDMKFSSGETWDWRAAGPRAVQIHFGPGETAATIVADLNETLDRLEYVSSKATIVGVRLVNGLPAGSPSALVNTNVGWIGQGQAVAMSAAPTAGVSQGVGITAPAVVPAIAAVANPMTLANSPAAVVATPASNTSLDIANGGLNRGAYGYRRIWAWGRPYYYWPYTYAVSYPGAYARPVYRTNVYHAPTAAVATFLNMPVIRQIAPTKVVVASGTFRGAVRRGGHFRAPHAAIHGAAAGKPLAMRR